MRVSLHCPFNISKVLLNFSVLQSGVIAVIAVAILIVVAVVLYAVYYRIMSTRKKRKERSALSVFIPKYCKVALPIFTVMHFQQESGGGLLDPNAKV
jgi:Na+/H+ antiporter NhaB